jgi:hypothetical protein
VKACAHGLVATVTASARAPRGNLAASWGNLAAFGLAACAACRLVADLACAKVAKPQQPSALKYGPLPPCFKRRAFCERLHGPLTRATPILSLSLQEVRAALRSRRRRHAREANPRGRDRKRQGETKGERERERRPKSAASTKSSQGERQRLRIEVGAPANDNGGGLWGALGAWRDRLITAPGGGGGKTVGTGSVGTGSVGTGSVGTGSVGTGSVGGGFRSGQTSATPSSGDGRSDGEGGDLDFGEGSGGTGGHRGRYGGVGGYGAGVYSGAEDNGGAVSSLLSSGRASLASGVSGTTALLEFAGGEDEERGAVGLFAGGSPIRSEGRGRSWEARDPEGTLDLDLGGL